MAEKVYTLKINGVEESVKAVDALNKQLDNLDKRIDELSKRNINVGTSGGGSAKQELSAQEQLEKQILATEQKLEQVRDENYKKLLHSKEELKEYTQIAKSAVAAEANKQGLFDTSTVAGMKAQLKSIKAEMQTIDIGGDRFRELTQQANDLNNKLKEIEQSYGQFGRNVGNYANSMKEGLAGVKIQVGDTVREFSSAREASRTLSNELKSMALNGQEGTKEFNELQQAVLKLNSAMKDVTVSSKAMDNLLDSMQGFVALTSAWKGLGSLFGIDNSEINESIQKLIALQNVLRGTEVIFQQLKSGEGFGAIFAAGNKAIDDFTDKLFKVKTAAKATATELTATGVAGKGAAAGMTTVTVATNAATTSLNLATGAAAALNIALKALGVGLVITAITTLISALDKLIDRQTEAKKRQEELNKVMNAGTKAYMDGMAQINSYIARIENFNGNTKQEKKLVDELNSSLGDGIGQYKTLKEWKDALDKKTQAYCKILMLQAEQQQLVNRQTEIYIKLLEAQKIAESGGTVGDKIWDYITSSKLGFIKIKDWGKTAKDKAEETKNALQAEYQQISEDLKKIDDEIAKIMQESQVGDYAPTIEKNKKKTKKAVKDAQHDINKAEIDAMKDGLNKKLMQLEEEKRQTINKLKENGNATAENIRKIEELFYKKRILIIDEHIKEFEKLIDELEKKVNETELSLNVDNIDESIKRVNQEINKALQTVPIDNELLMSKDEGIIGKALGYDLTSNFKARLDENKAYLNNYLQQVIGFNNDIKQLNLERANEERKQNLENAKNEYDETDKLLKEKLQLAKDNSLALIELQWKEDRILTEDEEERLNTFIDEENKANELIEKNKKQHTERLKLIEKQYSSTVEQIKRDETDSNREIYDKYYDKEISNLRDFLSAVNNEISKQPTMDKGGWQIINVGATQKQYDEIKKAADWALNSINNELSELQRNYADGIVGEETYNATMKQLKDLENGFTNTFITIDTNERNLLSDFQQSINRYIQAGLDAVRTVMDALADYQDYQFDKEEEMLDKQLEMIEDKLSEQADIIEKYKDKVDSIEDELATARGDRRQHLIDQINAEIAAQRNAQKEEQKLQKQKEAAEKKQEKLDKERKKAEYKRNLMNIIISTAMATANGLATQPFVPVGIAMGALATTLGMVQYALAAKQKPYAKGGQLDGGVAVGARHRDGGIKVLGGRAEIEGGEYITNRLTTAKNIDLLSYINSKKKKIDISDMIDFYNSGKVRTSIRSVRTKFEDGGYIPTLPASLDISDQLQNIVINKDNRPIVVSVVDINNKQEDVRRVQTLAGL